MLDKKKDERKSLIIKRGVEPSGVFLDLGISSPQFDDASRGFRPEEDGPLDLRFDATAGESAYEFLQRVDRDELIRAERMEDHVLVQIRSELKNELNTCTY